MRFTRKTYIKHTFTDTFTYISFHLLVDIRLRLCFIDFKMIARHTILIFSTHVYAVYTEIMHYLNYSEKYGSFCSYYLYCQIQIVLSRQIVFILTLYYFNVTSSIEA